MKEKSAQLGFVWPLVLVIVTVLVVFVLPLPIYHGNIYCKVGVPCPQDYWAFEKPLFWYLILPRLSNEWKYNLGPNAGGGATENNTPAPSPDETANWKTYTSPNRTFLLKYPPQLYETKKYIANLPVDWKDEGVMSTSKVWNDFRSADDYRLEFSTRAKKQTETLEEFVQRTVKEQSGEFFNPDNLANAKKKSIEVNGKASLMYQGSLGPAVEHVEVFIPHNNVEVTVIELWSNNPPPSSLQQKILDQILSTFRFE